LQAGGLFIKAESENDGASGLEFFLEQGFNRCAVVGLALSLWQVRSVEPAQYPNQPILVIGAPSSPDDFAYKQPSLSDLTRGGETNPVYVVPS
jgi:hypothetical protein